ncbi:hypothetical protein FRB95_001611 [Tulasnella sp. JGI-2019a]|nr:hypothetical protein FRB95_001611 [Tulasnella sp. JGI-2019a]
MEWYSPAKPGTGLHPRPGTAASLKAFFPELDVSYGSTWLPTRLGETPEQVQKRTDDFLEAFASRLESTDHPGRHTKILFVGHAASCITLIKSLAGSNANGKSLRIGCCSLTTMKREAGKDKAAVLGAYEIVGRVAEASFLTNGAEREWGFEDISIDETGKVVDDPGEPGTENEVEENVGLQILPPSARM